MSIRRRNLARFARPHIAAAGRGGFTLFELTVVVVIVGVLLAVAIHRLLPYIDEAERIAVLTTESQIRSSLVVAAAKKIAGGQAAGVSAMNGSNPIELMLEAPANYVGERGPADRSDAPRRAWYFDLETRRLVYRPGRPLGGFGADRAVENPAFEVRVAFADNDGNGTFEPYRDELHGVRLARVAGLEWLGGSNGIGQ